MSGSNKKIFTNQSHKDTKNKLKLVTHHWSAHQNKGFDIYYKIDKMLEDEYWKNTMEFTYIVMFKKSQISKYTNYRAIRRKKFS